MSKSKKTKSGPGQSSQGAESSDAFTSFVSDRGTRETIESIVIAIVLAFLFRAFEAEAFVIPTGSMAPTLQGRHIDVTCKECGHQYRTGASNENFDNRSANHVLYGVCPICRYCMKLERPSLEFPKGNFEPNPHFDGPRNPDHESFTGDRILVCKFAYALADPQRWDVIVFKYPKNGKQNYIKRLIGLPGETIKIERGDIYVKKSTDEEFRIARKPHYKIRTNLQLVDDTNYIATSMSKVGWPARWQQWSAKKDDRKWQVETEGRSQHFHNDGESEATTWLRYRHLIPRWDEAVEYANPIAGEWDSIDAGELPKDLQANEDGEIERLGELITDYYAYNFNVQQPFRSNGLVVPWGNTGAFWVGDLAVECEVDIESDNGELLLDLVEGGVHYVCTINVNDGEARLTMEDPNNLSDSGEPVFIDDSSGETSAVRTAKTELQGKGTYRIRFANLDDELNLWVNDRHVNFAKVDGPATYRVAGNERPYWSPSDPGDAEPAGIGSRGAAMAIRRLRVLRDVYYTSQDAESYHHERTGSFEKADRVDPTRWKKAKFVGGRDSRVFTPLGPDQFLPMGDNSPSSSDARYWGRDVRKWNGGENQIYVDRKLLTGKALYIYWPHGWNSPIPFIPNFERMRFIR